MRTFTSAILAGAVALSALSTAAYAENPMVGGAAMFADKNIVENAVNSKDHTTLVAAVQGCGPGRDAFGAPARSPSLRRPTKRSPLCPPAPSRPC